MRDVLPTIRMLLAPLMRWAARWLRRTFFFAGVMAALMIVLAFTRIPFDLHRWLGMAGVECTGGHIVVLGGSGMPSGPELLRLHHAALLAHEDTSRRITVIHPGTPDVLAEMVDELVVRGVALSRITVLNEGENTREQAMVFWRRDPPPHAPVILVTAPENMFRSVKTFQLLSRGPGQVCGASAWDHAMDHDFAYRHKAIGGKPWVPDVSDDPSLRYTFWNYLKLEITCLREFAAIAYYTLNGWI
ncbi:MAG TPA: ElyC/SanA/YdcF family protein [Flavobacteriales bacterium]|nr:ElyC/SanA/YdcF family protein [Flavobacteriales bacterium]